MNIGSFLLSILTIALWIVIYFFLVEKKSEKFFITWMTLILMAVGAVIFFSTWRKLAIEHLVCLMAVIFALLILLIANLFKNR